MWAGGSGKAGEATGAQHPLAALRQGDERAFVVGTMARSVATRALSESGTTSPVTPRQPRHREAGPATAGRDAEASRDSVQRRASRRPRLAGLVSELLAPAPVIAALLLAVSWRSAPAPGAALAWALLSAAFCSLFPVLYVLFQVRRGRLTDRHVALRSQRPTPLLVAGASLLIGLALLAATGAPRDVIALVGAGGAGLAVALAITVFWKISIHAAVVAGAVVVLALVFGPASLALAPLVLLGAWARVEAGAHTPAQVIAGAAVGAAVAGAAFPLLR